MNPARVQSQQLLCCIDALIHWTRCVTTSALTGITETRSATSFLCNANITVFSGHVSRHDLRSHVVCHSLKRGFQDPGVQRNHAIMGFSKMLGVSWRL